MTDNKDSARSVGIRFLAVALLLITQVSFIDAGKFESKLFANAFSRVIANLICSNCILACWIANCSGCGSQRTCDGVVGQAGLGDACKWLDNTCRAGFYDVGRRTFVSDYIRNKSWAEFKAQGRFVSVG